MLKIYYTIYKDIRSCTAHIFIHTQIPTQKDKIRK
jgi:hypothetical protein